MDLKIRTKSSVIGSMIFKSVLKSCVISLMIHKFNIKSSVIQSYGFTNIFDFIIYLNRFFWIFLLKIQRLKSEEKLPDLHILLGFINIIWIYKEATIGKTLVTNHKTSFSQTRDRKPLCCV